jgi:carbon monoxide dehydrogenase subunit G
MQIQNHFEIPMPPDAAWPLLMNIPATVPCFPGADLVETIDPQNYKGRVTVNLGPLTMVFSGNLRIENRDDVQHSATVKATWAEAKGRGNAITVTRFAMRAHGSGTMVDVDSDVQLAGQVAQYGRGAGMISEISAQLVSKFAENLRAHIHAMSPAPGEPVTEQRIPSRSTEISVLQLLWNALVNRIKRLLQEK